MDLEQLRQPDLLTERDSDVGHSRERGRQRRLTKILVPFGVLAV